ILGVTRSVRPRARTSAGDCEPTNRPRAEANLAGCAATGATGLALTGAGALLTTLVMWPAVVGGAGTATGATVVVGAGTVEGGTVGAAAREPEELNAMVGAAVAERGVPLRSTAKVTMIATPSMATTSSLGSATKRPKP